MWKRLGRFEAVLEKGETERGSSLGYVCLEESKQVVRVKVDNVDSNSLNCE